MVDANLDEVDQVAFDKKKAKLAKKGINIKSKEEKRQARRAREKARKNKKKGKGDGGGQEETMDFADFKEWSKTFWLILSCFLINTQNRGLKRQKSRAKISWIAIQINGLADVIKHESSI